MKEVERNSLMQCCKKGTWTLGWGYIKWYLYWTKLWKESLHLASVEELCQRCRYTPTALLSFLFLLLAASETIFIAYFTLFWSSKHSFSTWSPQQPTCLVNCLPWPFCCCKFLSIWSRDCCLCRTNDKQNFLLRPHATSYCYGPSF